MLHPSGGARRGQAMANGPIVHGLSREHDTEHGAEHDAEHDTEHGADHSECDRECDGVGVHLNGAALDARVFDCGDNNDIPAQGRHAEQTSTAPLDDGK